MLLEKKSSKEKNVKIKDTCETQDKLRVLEQVAICKVQRTEEVQKEECLLHCNRKEESGCKNLRDGAVHLVDGKFSNSVFKGFYFLYDIGEQRGIYCWIAVKDLREEKL